MKRILKLILLLLGAAGVVITARAFLQSLGPSEESLNESLVSISVPQLVEGVPTSIRIETADLIILRPSEAQVSSINTLGANVWDSAISTFNEDLQAYVYWGVSTRFGCALQHFPPQQSRIVEYNKDAVWLGGYWDDVCEVSYDYAGRAIKDYLYTYNGFVREFSNLKSPAVFEQQGDHYSVSIYQR